MLPESQLAELLETLAETGPKESLIGTIIEAVSKENQRLPMSTLATIFTETEDFQVTAVILEAIYSRLHSQLYEVEAVFYSTDNETLQRGLLVSLCAEPDLPCMLIILGIYLHYTQYRPQIRKTAFKDKDKLLLSLARYCYEHTLTTDERDVVQELLKTIPKICWHNTQGQLADSDLYTLYLAIPPKERHS